MGWYVVCGYDIPGHTHFLIVLNHKADKIVANLLSLNVVQIYCGC